MSNMLAANFLSLNLYCELITFTFYVLARSTTSTTKSIVYIGVIPKFFENIQEPVTLRCTRRRGDDQTGAVPFQKSMGVPCLVKQT
jgi:hypothetical protein